MRTTLTQEEMGKFAADVKYAFIGVINDEGYPHMNLFGSLEAKSDHELMFGKTYDGKTKILMQEKKKCSFILATLTREFWRGRLNFTGSASNGEDMNYYNEKPKNRYNAYYPVNEIEYFDLLDVDYGTLDFGAYVAAAHKAAAVAEKFVSQSDEDPLTGFVMTMLARQDCIKFLAYEGEDGYPRMLPLFQAIPVGKDRFIFLDEPNTDDVRAIPAGAKVTLHCICMFSMEAVQFRGIYQGLQDGVGVMDVRMIYNPMAPQPAFIYPRKPLEPVTEF